MQTAQMDEGRIATEVTIFADKICVDEEIVRLKSHIEAMKTCTEGRRKYWKEAGFHRTGDEPGGEYDSVKGQ